MNYFFGTPWALAGDKAAIPIPAQGSGALSFNQGYTIDYELDPETDADAKRIPRDETNQLYYLVTTAIRELQTQGIPDFIAAADNGGVPFSYAINAIVRFDDELFISLVGTNTATPADDTKWGVFDISGTGFLSRANNLSDLANVASARTNLELGSAALQSSAYFALAASPVITGGMTFSGSSKGNVVAMAALDIDLTSGEYFTKSINTPSTFTVSGATASKGMALVLLLTITSGATPTWPASFKWEGGVAPTLGNGTHTIGALTFDGGTSYTAVLMSEARA